MSRDFSTAPPSNPSFLLPWLSFPFRNSPRPHPRENRTFLFTHLREPILQPFYFHIHAGMGGYPLARRSRHSHLRTFQRGLDLSHFFSTLYRRSCATGARQPLCNQSITHSFHRNGGCTPSVHSSLRSSAYTASLRYLFPFSLPFPSLYPTTSQHPRTLETNVLPGRPNR
jgi:hypothetical protein